MAIFLHIGLNKAGTSSLQTFCHQHRDALREQGLEYPDAGIHDSAHYGLSKQLIGLPAAPIVPAADGMEPAIKAAIAAGRQVLLSSEYFFLANDETVGRVREYFARFDAECKIIVYLRRHDEWIASLFNQALKTSPKYSPWHSDIRDYTLYLIGSREMETRYPVILDRWARHFGDANILARPFEKEQFRSGEFVWDFLGNIDAALPGALQERGLVPARVNESIPEHLLRTIDYVRSAEISGKQKKAITALLLRSDAVPDAVKRVRRPWDGRTFTLPLYLRKAVVNLFAADYRYIAEHYLGAKDGVLFREPVA